MSIWIVISWIFVALLTGINIFLFLKLKSASEQMLKMAFPGAKNMGEAMGNMQQMLQGMQGGKFGGPMAGMLGAASGKGGALGAPQGGKKVTPSDPQLRAAMEMLQKMQKNTKRQ